MKSTQKFRNNAENFGADDVLKKPAKLEPIKKNGKEKRSFYNDLQNEDEDDELLSLHKRESILDYFDDGDEDEER